MSLVELTDVEGAREGVGVELDHTTARKLGPLYKTFISCSLVSTVGFQPDEHRGNLQGGSDKSGILIV